MNKKYELVNPFIIGSFNRVITADNSLQAAHLTYQSLSQYMTGHMPNFKFTLQRVKSGYQTGGGKDSDYLHFQVFEKKSKKSSTNENNKIEYAIKPITSSVMIDNFQEKLQKSFGLGFRPSVFQAFLTKKKTMKSTLLQDALRQLKRHRMPS